ncbi:hypothetical protein ElyMa_001960300 [Elysia marginata]|uniref:Uncharacterized protein n=1 Tax=Elysia marginata TaxID=1093978 RepID=A0AAV4EZ14_9GAST|nr:hypothetical protein ElyMa_001960300 [Elysia marginata]
MITTDADNSLLLSKTNEHNHDVNEQELQEEKLRVSLKRKAEGDISARPIKLVKSELLQQPDTDMLNLAAAQGKKPSEIDQLESQKESTSIRYHPKCEIENQFPFIKEIDEGIRQLAAEHGVE